MQTIEGDKGSRQSSQGGASPPGQGLKMRICRGRWQCPWGRGLAHFTFTALGGIISQADLSQCRGARCTRVDTGYRPEGEEASGVPFQSYGGALLFPPSSWWEPIGNLVRGR